MPMACIEAPPSGGVGKRACSVAESLEPCEDRLTEAFGCLGNARKAQTECMDSMTPIDEELAAAYAFQDNGIEVANVVHCEFPVDEVDVTLGRVTSELSFTVNSGCTEDFVLSVLSALDRYFDTGVRHIFPILDFNNAVGGPRLLGRRLRLCPWRRRGRPIPVHGDGVCDDDDVCYGQDDALDLNGDGDCTND